MACTESVYIDGASDLEDRITRLRTIINTLETRMVDAGASQSLNEEYSINDGQVVISTKYRDPSGIAKAIIGYERLLQKCYNQLNGHAMALRDWRGLQ